MPLWGTKSGYEFMPNWLNDAEKENCYATAAGWVLKHPNGTEELLVSIAGLATGIGVPTITGVKFASGFYIVGATKQVKVTYNEPVLITGTPTLTIADSEGNNATASFVSANATNTVLTFEFVVQAGSETLSVAAQNVAKPGGATIKERLPGTADAEVAISSGVSTAAKTKTVNSVPAIASLGFAAGDFVEGEVGSFLVTYTEPVVVTGEPTLEITDSEAVPAIVATYDSISENGLVLSFTFTVPGVASTLSIAAQSIDLTGASIKESKAPQLTNAAVVISAEDATAAGTKTIVAA